MDVDRVTPTGGQSGRLGLADMPWEVVVAIAFWMDGDAVYALARCSRALEPLARDSALWRLLCKRAFPQVLVDRLLANVGCDSGTRWRWEYAIRAFPPRKSRVHARGRMVDVEVGQRIEYLTGRRVCVRRGRFLSHPPHTALAAGGTMALIDTDPKVADGRCHVAYTFEPVGSLSSLAHNYGRITRKTYSDGNVWAYRQKSSAGDWRGAKRRKTMWFRFADDCADRRFAGMLLFRCGWVDVTVVIDDGDDEPFPRKNIFRPRAETPEAVAFDEAVLMGLVGWSDAQRRAYVRAFGVAACASASGQQCLFLAPPSADSAVMEEATEEISSRSTGPWRATIRPDDDGAPFDVQPASWRHIVCPLTRTPCGKGRDRCILSSGRIYDATAAAAWFDLLENNDMALCDPVTEEPVAPDVLLARWWMHTPDERWTGLSVRRAYHRLWTLVADGADLIATHRLSMTVGCLVMLDAFETRAHLALHPYASDDAWLARNADCIKRMRTGNLRETHDEWRRTITVWNFELVTAVDVDVPPHPPDEKGAHKSVAFTGATLVRVRFRDREFRRSVFAGAALVGCRFVRCRFLGCCFVEARFDGCRFDDCVFMTLPPDGKASPVPIVSHSVHHVLARLGCHRVSDTW